MKTLLELIKEGLKINGFDGLYADGCCACDLNDFAPCMEGPTVYGELRCNPGYRHTHSKTGNFVIAKQKEPLTDAEIDSFDYQ